MVGGVRRVALSFVVPALIHRGRCSLLCCQPDAFPDSLTTETSQPAPGRLCGLRPCRGRCLHVPGPHGTSRFRLPSPARLQLGATPAGWDATPAYTGLSSLLRHARDRRATFLHTHLFFTQPHFCIFYYPYASPSTKVLKQRLRTRLTKPSNFIDIQLYSSCCMYICVIFIILRGINRSITMKLDSGSLAVSLVH